MAATVSEAQLKKKDEDEYQFLRRQYALMENDTAAFVGGARNRIVQQKRMMESLKAVKTDIMTQVAVAQNPFNVSQDSAVAANITRLLDQGEHIDEEIQRKRKHLVEIDKEMKKLDREVTRLRMLRVSDAHVQSKAVRTQRAVRTLEQRLHVETLKYNAINAENVAMRADIASLLRQRREFNASYQKLMSSLQQGKKVMLDLIEQATLAYDQREEADSMLDHLRGARNRNVEMQRQLMEEMEISLDRQNALRDFLRIKAQKRVMLAVEQRKADKRDKDRASLERKMADYSVIVHNIETLRHEEGFGELTQALAAHEQNNWALYSHVIELHRLTERLQGEVLQVREEFDVETNAMKKIKLERINTLTALASELEQREVEVEQTEWERELAKCQLNKLLADVDHLCHKMRASRTTVMKRLGGNQHPHQHNFMRYLEEVEKKALEILENVNLLEQSQPAAALYHQSALVAPCKLAQFHPAQLDKMVATQPCAICSEVRSLNDLDDAARIEPLNSLGVRSRLDSEMCLENFSERMHNLSACRQPRSRKILQRRYN